jgi:hypothetical protein
MNRWRESYKWIVGLKQIYFFVAVVILFFNIDPETIKWSGEFYLRIYGLFLQIVGTVMVLFSIRERFTLFKKHGVIKEALLYFKKFPLFKGKQHLRMQADAGSFTLVGGEVRGVVGPKPEINDVIRFFKEENNYIQQLINQRYTLVSKRIEEVNQKIDTLNGQIKAQVEKTDKLLAVALTPDVLREFFGVLYLVVGMVMSTIPDVISSSFPLWR